MQNLASWDALAQRWQNFYLLVGTAAATLTGLMFLALTFGSRLAPKNAAVMRAFTSPIVSHFIQVLLISCLLTVPELDASVLGGSLLVMGGVRIFSLVGIYRHLRRAHQSRNDLEASDWLLNIVSPLVCYLSLIAAATLFFLRRPVAFAGLAAASAALLTIGILGSWELLIWMAGELNLSETKPKN